VGLRDGSYTPQRMSLLARVGGGAFIESTSSQLARVFTQIEAGLTSAYVVHYRSPAPPGHRVTVSISVDGIQQAATLQYTSPGAARLAPGATRASTHSFWTSTLALVVFSFAAALLLSFGFFVLVAPRLFRGRLRRRVGEFTAAGLSNPRQVTEATRSPRVPLVERLLERTAWWERFKGEVAIARIKRAPIELVGFTVIAASAVSVMLGFLLGTIWIAILALLLSPLALRSFVRHRLRRQRDLFADQLPAHLQEVASAMRAGHSLVSGITSMARDAPEPSRTEWRQVIADEQLGVPLDEAMRPIAERMNSDDVNQVALVAALHQRTGGNMAEVLERVADSVRERAELRRELHALTAQARLSRYIVTALPPVVAAAVALLDPSYIRPLFHTTTGVILVFLATGLLVSASLIMRAITDIEV
jgi:tight adherence protein B